VDIVSLNTFFPAGHGTFFAGYLISRTDHKVAFSWVYDCGSKRRSWLSDLIDSYKKPDFPRPFLPVDSREKIDMLCVSHFDADHVNGLEKLLSEFSVDTLVLPYLPLNTRLEIVLSLDLEAPDDTSAMLFAIDPIGFLTDRGYLEKISKVLFIKGSNSEGAVPISNGDFNPRGPDENSESIFRNVGTSINSDENYNLEGLGQSKVWALDDKSPVRIFGFWEFVFYNKELPGGLAPKSSASLIDIQKEVIKTLLGLNLTGKTTKKDTTKWRKKIREIYEKHFGSSSEGRNDISLVLYSNHITTPFRLSPLWPYRYSILTEDLYIPISCVPISEDKSGLLLTGDITLRHSDISTLQSHLGGQRWKSVNLLQIPHHGSIHSWQVGNAKLLPSEFNVFNVPDSDKSGHHPHIDVLEDFKNKKILFANYSTGVSMNFALYCEI